MKILSSAQIRLADQFTILNEPISSLDLMERAANCCFSWIVKKYPQSCFHVVAGKGNNGGDGLVIARKLLESGFKVRTSLIQHSTKGSIEYETNLKRLKQQKASLKLLELGNKLVVHNDEVLIDALFGSGLTRPIASNSDLGLLIHQMNKCNETVAIDIPSGLFADDNSDNLGAIIRAKYTLTFQAPKLAFMHDSSHQFVGEFAVLNIGLHPQYLQEAKTNYHFVSREISALELKPVIKTAHKGTNGRALLIAGTKGKMGAAILASKAALRVGVGLLSVKVPEFGLNLIQGTVPEAMAIGDSNEKYNTELPNLLGFDAIGIGPGIDTSVACEQLISELIQTYSKPMVIDADALNLLSKRKDLWSKLPHGSILTPHLGEFQRLFGSISSPEEAMKMIGHYHIRIQRYFRTQFRSAQPFFLNDLSYII